jgi:acyl carrier protein
MTPALAAADRAVRELLAELTLNGECLTSTSDAGLEEMGVTSVSMIELVYAVEDRFSIQIEDQEVRPENFGSIGSLVALVARKMGSPDLLQQPRPTAAMVVEHLRKDMLS